MFAEQGLVTQGALVDYGVSYYEVGRLSARYAQWILTGANPQKLPVETISRAGLAGQKQLQCEYAPCRLPRVALDCD